MLVALHEPWATTGAALDESGEELLRVPVPHCSVSNVLSVVLADVTVRGVVQRPPPQAVQVTDGCWHRNAQTTCQPLCFRMLSQFLMKLNPRHVTTSVLRARQNGRSRRR